MDNKIVEIKDTTDIILSDKDLSYLASFGFLGLTIMFGLMTFYFGKNAIRLDHSEKKEEDI